MSVILEPEFILLEQELKDIKSLVGLECPEKLEVRKKQLLDRLDESKKSRIKRSGFKLIQTL